MKKVNYIYYKYENCSFTVLWFYSNKEVVKAKLKPESKFYQDIEKCRSNGIIEKLSLGEYEVNNSLLTCSLYADNKSNSTTGYFSKEREYYKTNSKLGEKLVFTQSKYGFDYLEETFFLYKKSGLGLLNSEFNDLNRPIKFFNHDDVYPIVLLPLNMHYTIYNEISDEEVFDYLGIEMPVLKLQTLPESPKEYRLSKRKLLGFFETKQVIKIPLLEEEFKQLKNQYFEEYERVKKENDAIENKFKLEKESLRKTNLKELLKAKHDIFYYNKLETSTNLEVSNIRTSNRRGRMELLFLDELLKKFHSQVKVDSIITNCNYNPDFIIISKYSGVHVDIEIDEPYTNKMIGDLIVEVEKGVPIHYIDCESDNDRNEIFLNNNWIIIRFSEKQIIQESSYCVDFVAHVINAIEDKSHLYELNVTPEKRWTYEEARSMFLHKVREKY